MSHTQGKLSISDIGVGFEIQDEEESVIFQAQQVPKDRGHNRRIANARRLVACWNACDGIGTEELEAGSIQKLREQRDELLAALKAIRNASSHVLNGGFEREATEWADALFECLDQATEQASATIAKVESSHE